MAAAAATAMTGAAIAVAPLAPANLGVAAMKSGLILNHRRRRRRYCRFRWWWVNLAEALEVTIVGTSDTELGLAELAELAG